MTLARASLLLPLLAIAACETQRKPLRGFDRPPPGILVGQPGGNTVLMWPLFDLPLTPHQIFRPRLNGQDTFYMSSQEGFYEYSMVYLQGWTGGFSQWVTGIPSGTYIVELIDAAGQSWGQSAPLPISSGDSFLNPTTPLPTVVFAHYEGQTGSWIIDPTMRDADPATDEITVTNLVDENVVVERCLITAGSRTSCMPVGTVAPGADLLTVETVAGTSMGDHQALLVHLASDAAQEYQRDLVQKTINVPDGCQMERIIVHGRRPFAAANPTGSTAFAMSSCYGYASGGGP
jgi:hypothetical protein